MVLPFSSVDPDFWQQSFIDLLCKSTTHFLLHPQFNKNFESSLQVEITFARAVHMIPFLISSNAICFIDFFLLWHLQESTAQACWAAAWRIAMQQELLSPFSKIHTPLCWNLQTRANSGSFVSWILFIVASCSMLRWCLFPCCVLYLLLACLLFFEDDKHVCFAMPGSVASQPHFAHTNETQFEV